MTGLWIALAAVVVAVAFGLYRAFTDGRFGGTHRVDSAERGAPADRAAGAGAASGESDDVTTTWSSLSPAVDADLGQRATLVQFSSAFCAPCRATRRILSDVAETVPGVVHVEIDAEHHLDVVRELKIMRTPTTILLDADGAEVTRAAGAPRKEQVLAALTGL